MAKGPTTPAAATKSAAQLAAEDFLTRYPAITEMTIAKEIGQVRAGLWRYDPRGRGWYVWSGTHWEGDREADVADAVAGYCLVLSMVAASKGSITQQRLEKIQTSGFAGGVAKMLKSHALLRADQDGWDADPFLLGTPGGTVDLRTGVVRPPRAQDYITKLTAVAPAEPGAPCEGWMAFLGKATEGLQEKQTFLQQWAGIGLTGDVSEQYFVDLYGPGGNGKSVYIGVLVRILGSYHVRADLDLFLASRHSKHPTGLMSMKGARMVTCVEVEEGRAWDNRAIKTVTGGDRQKARFMHKDFVEFDPTASFTVVGDHLPNLDSVGAAMRRRVLVLEFLYTVAEAERRKHLADELLAAEGPAILRWAIDGCVAWQKKDGAASPSRSACASPPTSISTTRTRSAPGWRSIARSTRGQNGARARAVVHADQRAFRRPAEPLPEHGALGGDQGGFEQPAEAGQAATEGSQ